MEEIEDILLKSNLEESEIISHVFKALTEYEAYLKAKKEYPDDATKQNLKTLMGLIKYNKFDLKKLNLSLVVTLSLVLIHYDGVIKYEAFVNDNINDKLSSSINKLLEEEEKKTVVSEKTVKEHISDEKLIMINKANNKRKLNEVGVSVEGRRMIYQMIDRWIDKNCVPGEKTKPGEYKSKFYHFKFIARINKDGQHIYKINEVSRINDRGKTKLS